jgi:hypothetical protein
MSDPITAMAVGAAIGGGTSLARGKSFGSALQSAALGGALGGGGSALGGLMSSAGAGVGTTAGTLGQGAGSGLIGGANLTGAGVATGAGTGATSGLGSFLSNIKGIETAPVSMGTGGYASGIGGQAVGGPNAMFGNLGPGQSLDEILNLNIPKQNLADLTSPEAIANNAFSNSKFQPSGLFEPSSFRNLDTGTSISAPFSTEAFTNNPLMAQQIINNAGQTASTSFLDKMGLGNLSTMDKINIGKIGLDAGFPNQAQQMIQPELRPITRGNPEMVSTSLYNVAPNVGMQQGNELGLPNLLSRMPLTEEELLKLQQQMQTTGFRGR